MCARPLFRTLTLVAVIVAATLAGSGCTDNAADALFERYLARIERTLGTDAGPVATTELPRPPRSGTLRLTLDSGKLDTLDFLALSGCAVQVNIARRNSSLGRLARASQRLLLDLEYLQLAPACITALRAEQRQPLAATLQAAWEQKREQLPAAIFNATLGGEEFRAFWLVSRPTGTYPPVGDSSVVDALGAINAMAQRWLDGDYRADNLRLELALADIAGGGGGALLQALTTQSDWLSHADTLLQTRADKGPLCAGPIRHSAADVLPNVVRRFFIDGIQPAAAVMENRRYALFPQVTALEERINEVLPAAYRNWQRSRNALIQHASDAPKRHVAQLQRILAPCTDDHPL